MSEVTVSRNEKHVAIYFTPGSSEVMKALAANVRSQGGKTVLVWSQQWKGPENLIMEARAVIIEIGSENDVEIAQTYLQFTQDVEVHFVDHNGDFVDAPAELEMNKESTDAETEASESNDGTEEKDQSSEVDGPADVPEEADQGGDAAAPADGDSGDAEAESGESGDDESDKKSDAP